MHNFDPLKELKNVGGSLTRVFEDAVNYAKGGLHSVAVDLYETPDHIVIVAGPLHRVKPESLDIEVNGDLITISGETEADPEVPDEAYLKRERHFGEFRRTVKLDIPFDGSATKAQLKQGILKVLVPKIQVEVEEIVVDEDESAPDTATA